MNKKVLAILLMASLLGCGVQNSAFANIVETQQSAENVTEQSQQEEQLVISPRIEKELRTNKKCPHCGGTLYLSDVPHYEYVCPICDENFYEIEV